MAGEKKANGLTLRGFSARPHLPSYEEVYGLKAAAIAVYPMYKGLARLVGMEIVGKAQTLAEQIDVLEQHWKEFDFFFIHFKYTDCTGEDGTFDAKVQKIEELDAVMPRVTKLEARRADRHRRPQHAQLFEEPQLASGADAAGAPRLPHRRLPGVQRERIAARRLGAVRGQVSDAAGAGQRRPAGEIRGVRGKPGALSS